MTKRVILSTLLGAIIYYFFGMFSWMMMPYHKQTLNQFTNESVIIGAIKKNAPTSGIYVTPTMFGKKSATDNGKANSAQTDASAEKAKDTANQGSANAANGQASPLIFVSVQHEGTDQTMRTQMFLGALNALIGAFLISLLLLFAKRTGYSCRVGMVIIAGALAGITGQFPNYVWWGFSLPFILTNILDYVVGWGLAGLFMAAIVKKTD